MIKYHTSELKSVKFLEKTKSESKCAEYPLKKIYKEQKN